MKKSFTTIVFFTAVTLLLAGCGKKSSTGQKADPFGTNNLETVFAAAAVPQKNLIQQAETHISAHDYGMAYDLLQNLSRDATLTTDQAQAIKNALLELGNYPRRAP